MAKGCVEFACSPHVCIGFFLHVRLMVCTMCVPCDPLATCPRCFLPSHKPTGTGSSNPQSSNRKVVQKMDPHLIWSRLAWPLTYTKSPTASFSKMFYFCNYLPFSTLLKNLEGFNTFALSSIWRVLFLSSTETLLEVHWWNVDASHKKSAEVRELS